MKKISKQNAEHYRWGEQCDGWHLVKKENVSIIHERMPALTSEVKHYHQLASQFFFVLSGVLTIELESEELRLHPQEGLEVPSGVTHQVWNKSEQEVEFLVVSQPTSKGDRVLVN